MRRDPTLAPRILLVTGLFLCPVLFDRGAAAPFDFPKVTVLWVFTVAALGLWLAEVIRGRAKPVAFRLSLIGGAFVLAVGVATIFSRTPVVSFFGWHLRSTGFLGYTLYAAIGFLVAQLYWRRPERLKELVYALGAASSIAAVYVIVQWLGLDPFSWGPGKRGRFGTLGNSNFTGGFLGATSPWLLFAFWRAPGPRWRALVVAWAAVTWWALFLTESRGGLAALVVAAVVAAVAFRRRLPRWLPRAGAAVLVAVVVVAAVAATRPSGSRPGVSVPGSRDLLRTDTLEIRTFWWRSALSIFAANPLFGAGPDTFVVVFPRYMPREAAGKVQIGSGAEAADKPHNVFLDHAASMGLLGAGAFGALLVAAVIWGLRRMRRADAREGDLLGTFLALLGGYAGQAFFSIDIAPLAMLAWVSLGGIAAVADPRSVAVRERPDPQPRMTPLRWAAVASVAVLTVLAIVAGTRPWRADRASRVALEAADSEDFASAERSRAQAIALYPVDPEYHRLAGEGLLRQADRASGSEQRDLTRRALGHFERADKLQPGFHLLELDLGETYSRLGVQGELSAFYQSGIAFEDATELAPNDWRVWVRYADMLNRWGRADGQPEHHCLALDKLDEALELRSGDPSAWRSLAVSYTHLKQFDRALEAIERAVAIDPSSEQASRIRDQILELGSRGGARVEC